MSPCAFGLHDELWSHRGHFCLRLSGPRWRHHASTRNTVTPVVKTSRLGSQVAPSRNKTWARLPMFPLI